MKRAVLLAVALMALLVPSASGQVDDCDGTGGDPCVPGPDADYNGDGVIDAADQAVVDAIRTGDCSYLADYPDIECDFGTSDPEASIAPSGAPTAAPVRATPSVTG